MHVAYCKSALASVFIQFPSALVVGGNKARPWKYPAHLLMFCLSDLTAALRH